MHKTLESEVIQQQENEYIKVIYNMGQYCLAPEFQKFSVSPFVWSQKTPEQQREHAQKVFKVPISSSSSDRVKPTNRLSTAVDCGVTSVHQCSRPNVDTSLEQSRNHSLP